MSERSTTAGRRPLVITATLLAVVIALAGGMLLGATLNEGDVPANPSEESVDAGFSRDMSAHHSQAVEMSYLVRERSDNAAVDQLALDIMLTQQQQVGQMFAWLESWELSKTSSGGRMGWMADSMSGMDMADTSTMPGGMPGMASNAELRELEASAGSRADRIYLQLMIPHHQAGVEMADYAVEHAETEPVRRLAESVSVAQQSELTVLTDMLEERGGPVPLAPNG